MSKSWSSPDIEFYNWYFGTPSVICGIDNKSIKYSYLKIGAFIQKS